MDINCDSKIKNELRAECELLHLLLAETNRALVLEGRQHRKSLIADAATQTEPAPDRQHSSAQTDLPLFATPTPQSRPNTAESSSDVLNAKWPEYLQLIDIPARTTIDTDLRDIHSGLAVCANITAQELRHFSTEEKAADREIVADEEKADCSQTPGTTPQTQGKAPLVEEKTPPEPMASVAVDLTTTD
ncbi:hypothetical protein TSAR_011226 [Trichomalopsis sarcophagae]|uniref:Uncharacterized protein n=1 Tax=Trichomalopsis sarcophagae TaxID=543379 RepID=A0A232FI67_9HYME|nr:hypothetical protein TSAR_011226 [Trichomalopsis sarcophagae]